MDNGAGKGNGHSIFRSFRARHAEDAIEHSQGLVTVLRLSQVDLKPAEEALTIAKDLYQSHQFSKALNAARRAEAIAITLDERFGLYQSAVKTLQIRIDDLARLGLRTEELDAVLGRAEEKVMAGVLENGAYVPNYVEATALLKEAAERGRRLLMDANAASNRIFLAELAMESLSEMKGLADPKAFGDRIASEFERSLEEATRELALGHVDVANRIASDLEAHAVKTRGSYLEATKILDSTEARLGELRADGIVTERIDRQIAFARDMLSKAMIPASLEMARRLAEEAVALGEAHVKASTAISDADVLYARLVREGFHSYEADAAIKDAKRAFREGSYARVLEHVEKAHEAFSKRRNAREALARALEETRKRVIALQDTRYPLLPDVQEILGRAEREFRHGNYTGSTEDLQIATVLLSRAAKAATPKR